MISAAPFALAQFDDGGDDVRVGVDDLVAVILDEVRLEHDALALERHRCAEVLVLLSAGWRRGRRRSCRPARCGRTSSPAAARSPPTPASSAAEPRADARQDPASPLRGRAAGDERAGLQKPVRPRLGASRRGRKSYVVSHAEGEHHQRLPITVRLQPARRPRLSTAARCGSSSRLQRFVRPSAVRDTDRGRALPSTDVRYRRC